MPSSFVMKNHKVSVHSIKCIHPHVSRSQYRASCSDGKEPGPPVKRTTPSAALQKRTSLFLEDCEKNTLTSARLWIQPTIYPSPHLSCGLLPSTNHRSLNAKHQSHCCVRTETNIKPTQKKSRTCRGATVRGVLPGMVTVLCLEMANAKVSFA